jgi:DNA invertase Pin-like site-specific DNA recombinase
MEFVGYIRVSTTRQGESRLGLQAQEQAIRHYVSGLGGNLVEMHLEVESGRCANRPILSGALAQCRRTKAKLVVAKLDRLSRSVAFVSQLMESRVDFVAVDFPAANTLMLHIIAAFSQFEREQISSRTKAALAAAKARGVVLGSFGKELAARNRADAQSFADSLRQPITAMIQAGNDTLQGLAENLDRAGILTREGATWAPTSVLRVLRRLELRTPAMSMAA